MEAVSAVILSGGKSSRMGVDKALLEMGGRSFVSQICENLWGADEIFLSVRKKGDFAQIPIRHVADEYPGCGPMAGIHSALKSCRNSWLFVAACDMPYAAWEMAEELYNRVGPSTDAVIPIGEDGRFQVLCGLYHKRLVPVLEQRLQAGIYRMQNMLEEIHAIYVPERELKGASQMLRNINTPQEYFALQEQKKIPVFSIVAYSGTGKTTFLEKLIPELKRRGIRTAVIKHDAHEFEMDREGKDSDRITKAGADVTALISGTKAVLMENRSIGLECLLDKIQDVDIILTEGYKTENWPKIMIYRESLGKPMPLEPKECLAVVSDVPLKGAEHFYCLQPYVQEKGGAVSEDIQGIAELLVSQVKKESR